MSLLEYSTDRLRAIIEEVERLASTDFPHRHSADVLKMVGGIFQERLSAIERLDDKNDISVIKAICSDSLGKLFTFLPLLGFILRSTNVRNSFEVYGPTLRLARQLLGDQTKLLISSEWNFSPFVYRPLDGLPGVVLIGLPACESQNPLLLPLAGHELGHALWRQKTVENSVMEGVQKSIASEFERRVDYFRELFPTAASPSDAGAMGDLFYSRVLYQTAIWTLARCEETFCDFVGIRLFGEGYLHAFGYLLSPGGLGRSPHYPAMAARISNMLTASEVLNVPAPDNFRESFDTDQLPQYADKESSFMSEVSDVALQTLTTRLLDAVNENIPAALAARSQEGIDRVYRAFTLAVPATSTDGLASIVNAGWKAYHDKDFWSGIPDLHKKKGEVLRDLILKNIELLEIEEIMGTT